MYTCKKERKFHNFVISPVFLLSKFEFEHKLYEKNDDNNNNEITVRIAHTEWTLDISITISSKGKSQDFSSSSYWCWIWENCIVNRGDKVFNVGNKSTRCVLSSLLPSSSLVSIDDEIAERLGEKIELTVEFRWFRIVGRSVILVWLLLLLLLLWDRMVDSIDCCVKPKSWILNKTKRIKKEILFSQENVC